MSPLRRAVLYIALGYVLAFVTVPLVSLMAAAQTYAVATLASYHFDRKKDYNENNFGLGIEHRFSDAWAMSAGFFRNSFDRHTNYVFAGYTPIQYAGWRVGAVVGGVTGYSEGVDPWLTGIATRDFGRVGLNLVFSPAGVALQIKLMVGK